MTLEPSVLAPLLTTQEGTALITASNDYYVLVPWLSTLYAPISPLRWATLFTQLTDEARRIEVSCTISNTTE